MGIPQPEDLKELEVKFALEGLKVVGKWVAETIHLRSQRKEEPALKSISAKLDELVEDVSPCFTVSGLRSFIHVTSNLGIGQDDAWRQTNDGLAMASSWFAGFAGRRDPRRKVEPDALEERIAELNSLLFWTCRLGQQLRALVQKASGESGGRISFKPLADHFDSFLTRYEALLEKLPEELHVRGGRPAPGMTRFFLRLRD
jgi:hypothetical protein